MAHMLALSLPQGWPRTRVSAYGAAWAGLAVAALMALFPLRFTAATTVEFAVGVQPPAVLVRGMEQLIGSRELAYDTLQKLDAEDVARLAAGGAATVPGSERDARSGAARAAWRLMDNLDVRPLNGGRTLEISVAAPTSALAARVANAYVTALLDLQATAQARGPAGLANRELQREDAGGLALPALSRGPAARLPVLPDPPRPLWLALLAMGTVTLLLSRTRWPRRATPTGPVDGAVLPIELTGSPKVEWLDAGEEEGLSEDEAVARLSALLPPPARLGQVVLLTSDDLQGPSARCAVDLARRLSDDARVALVALDGTAPDLGALVSDPRAPGVSELLFGVAGFGETIHRDLCSRAHIIPPGRDARGGPSVVGADRLALILGALRQTYDYVVVAAPSLAGSRGAQRLVALDPLLVHIHGDGMPATAAVESFDALVARRFPRVVMLCLATGAFVPAEESDADAPAPPPSMGPIASPQAITAPQVAAASAAPPATRALRKPVHKTPAPHSDHPDQIALDLGEKDEAAEQPPARRRRKRPPLAGAA